MDCCILVDVIPEGVEEEHIHQLNLCNLYVSFKQK